MEPPFGIQSPEVFNLPTLGTSSKFVEEPGKVNALVLRVKWTNQA
jgi:hypothetical protein